MAEFLRIDVQGNTELLRQLDDAVRRIRQPRELLQALGARLEANINFRFDGRVDPEGNPWAPLSPATIEIYESDWFIKHHPEFRGGIPGGLLERTRNMRKSLGPALVGEDSVEVGMSRLTDKGGKWSIPLLHETGTRKMPRRGIFFADPDSGTLGAQDDEDLQEEISAFLDEVFGA